MPRRSIACLLLLLYLPACTSWAVQRGLTPEQLITAEHPTVMRVTRPDGSFIVLERPRIVGDSLAGVTPRATVTVAVADVTQVAIRQHDAVKTTALIVGVGVLGAIAATAWLKDVFGGFLGN